MSRKRIVIAGPPRTGTRFITDALNKHPDVAIQGEVPPNILDHTLQFMHDCDQSFAKNTNQRWTTVWTKARIDMFDDILMSVQKRPGGVINTAIRRKAKFTGFKLPAAVERLKELESVYKDPAFVLSIREFAPFHLSCVSRWPHLSIKDTSRNYLRALGEIRETVDRYERTFVFPLEHLKSHGVTLLKELGQFLGLPNVDEWAADVDPSKKANESEKFTTNKRVELSEQEKQFIENTPNMAMLYDSVLTARTYSAAA